MKQKIEHTLLLKDYNYPDNKTIYWFDVKGEVYGLIAASQTTKEKVVDCDGVPTTDYKPEQFTITERMLAL